MKYGLFHFERFQTGRGQTNRSMDMGRLTKSMLALVIMNAVASVLFLSGLVDVSGFPGLYVVFPLAATFYGLFLISRVFQKDMARFDAEHRAPDGQVVMDDHIEFDESGHGHEYHEPMHA
jgi:hypothetical protein